MDSMTADIVEMREFVRKINKSEYRGCNTCRFYQLASMPTEDGHVMPATDIVFCTYLQEDAGLQTQCPYYAESDNSKTRNDPIIWDS